MITCWACLGQPRPPLCVGYIVYAAHQINNPVLYNSIYFRDIMTNNDGVGLYNWGVAINNRDLVWLKSFPFPY